MPKENATGAHTSRGLNIVLYIWAITGLEKQKPKGKKTVAMSNDTENLVDELSQDSAVSEEQSVEPPLDNLNAYPEVAFWIAFDTPLCTVSYFENKLEKAFSSSRFLRFLNIYECKIVKPRSTKTKNVSDPVEYFTSALSQVIKDHNWPCAIDIAKESPVNFANNVFNRDFEPLQGIPMAMIGCDVRSVVPDDPRFSKRVVKIVIMLILQLRSQIKAISIVNKAYL